LSAERLYQEAGLNELRRRYDIAIRAPDSPANSAILGDQTLFDRSDIRYLIPLASGNWELAMQPRGGWITTSPELITQRGLFLLATIMALLLTHHLLRLREENNRISGQLRGAIEVLPDGFVVYDNQDRMVMCNDKYKEFYAKSAPAMVPGNSFENILRYGLENGQYSEAKGREAEWLAERLALHNKDASMVEQRLEDGRWLRIIERATPEGGRAGVRLDITALKRHEAQLKDSNERLKAALAERDAAEARFAEISDISTEWFWEQDEDMRFTYFSNGFQRATGVDPKSILGKRRVRRQGDRGDRKGLDGFQHGSFPQEVWNDGGQDVRTGHSDLSPAG